MNEFDISKRIDLSLNTMRIIVIALCLGIITFAGVAVFLRAQGDQPVGETSLLSYLGIAFALGASFLSFVMPNTVIAGWRRQAQRLGTEGTKMPEEPLEFTAAALPIYQTALIIGCALIEGAAFFNLIAYLLEGQTFSLALALALLVLLALKFPSRLGVERWAAAQQDLLAQERQNFS